MTVMISIVTHMRFIVTASAIASALMGGKQNKTNKLPNYIYVYEKKNP
jgi:hypothetical protein